MSGQVPQWFISILRAAHCRSTHHYFAVDALPLVRTEAGLRLVSHLLAHHDNYLRGAKDPDTRFRDFQNHVVHVDDGYWGGAPRVAHQWYDRMQRYLHERRYEDAAHAAGVLSHYFTDPIQPLHTAQSSVEQVLHRPIEWSITKTYTELFERWKSDDTRIVFQLSDQPGWLGEAILHAARTANKVYPRLLEQFDLAASRRDPPAGLNDELRQSLSDLIGLAVTGWARVLERAAWDAQARQGRPLPSAGLTVAGLLAGIRVPSRLWLKRIEHRIEQNKVADLIAEFQRDGRVTQHLPSEQRVITWVREIRHRELEFQNRRNPSSASVIEVIPANQSETPAKTMPSDIVPFPTSASKQHRLHVGDQLAAAPSIGPKTAARFAAVGVVTVADFLKSDLDTLHRQLATGWITRETLAAWRFQTILMCQLPSMLAREVQILVGCGLTTADTIARTPIEQLVASVTLYCESYAGRRVLRGAAAPDRQRLETIIGDAAMALVQQKRALARDMQTQDTQTESPNVVVRSSRAA